MTACPSCGQEVADDSRFCPSCGTYLGWQHPATPPRAAPEQTSTSPPRADSGTPDRATSAEAPSPAAPSLGDAVDSIATVQRLAARMGRPDVEAHLARTRETIERRELTVAVIGEFKRGKSTLVNALLRVDVCPVDADVVTAVPTTIRHGTPPSATASVEAPGGAVTERPVPLDDLIAVVGERRDESAGRIRSVEVRLDLRMLSGGLCIVDTPGVGGLESAHGEVTLAALTSVEALVFVTDASQELTAPEVAFLRQALRRCPRALLVVTKTDLYPQWRRMVALDEQHLEAVGIDVPVLPVSSFLRLRARAEEGAERSRLNTESNFKGLYDWLAREVLASADRRAAVAAGEDIAFAQRQLSTEVETEHLVLTQPHRASEIVERLEQASVRRKALSTPAAGWQQELAFGIEDLVSDVQHDLAERVKKILREAEGAVDETDPKESWETVGAWLQKQAVSSAAANHDLMRDRAARLAQEVAEAFALEASTPLRSTPWEASGELGTLAVGTLDDSALKAGRMTRFVLVGRTATLVPMMTFGLAGHLLLMSVVGPMAVVAGAWIGGKMIKDERARQLTYRRQLAKAAVRRYLDDVQFVLNKDCRDALSATRRDLLLEFQSRAEVLQLSAERAWSAARRAAETPPQQVAGRVADVEQQAAALARAGTRERVP